jgi:hypothetical protein
LEKKKVREEMNWGRNVGEEMSKKEIAQEELTIYAVKRYLGYNFFPFNLETSPFRVSNIFVLHDTYCFFNYFDRFLQVTPEFGAKIRLFLSF